MHKEMKKKVRTPMCTRQSDEMSYFTFWPLIIFSFYFATERETQSDLTLYHPSAQLVVWFFIMLTHMFCINTIVVAVIEVYFMNFNSTETLCRRVRVLEYNGILATISLLSSVVAGVFASFTIDLDRDEYIQHRPAWLRVSSISVTLIVLGWSLFVLFANNRRKP